MWFTKEAHAKNAELLETLLAFTGIDEDNIEFSYGFEVDSMMQISKRDLPQEQASQLLLLEEYVEMANAPFWEDRDLHDPVFVRIGLPARWNHNEGTFHLSHFILFLYDPDLVDMPPEQFALETAELRDDILSYTGISPGLITFSPFPQPEQGFPYPN